jgi:hypothetical protein
VRQAKLRPLALGLVASAFINLTTLSLIELLL